MRQDEVLLGVFSFDQFSARSTPAVRRSAVDTWLLENPGEWRLEEKKIALDLSTQYAAIIRGEEGAGKTTELGIIAEELRAQPGALTLWLDFTACPEADYARALPGFLRQELQSSIRAAGLFMEYRAALIRLQLEADFHSFYPLQQEARGNFSSWPDDRILTDERILTACAIFEAIQPDAANLLSLKAAQSLRDRAYLLVDNSDLLGRARVQALARLISGNLLADSYLIATTRPENYVAWARGANERRTLKKITLLSTSDRLFKIVERRIGAGETYVRLHQPELLSEFGETTLRLRKAVSEIAGDESATRLVSDWHNRSVRQMLPSLIITASECAQRSDGESLHGVVFRTLVKHAMPEALVDIYTPDFPVTRRHENFVFLKLRILAYLYKHRKDKETPTLDQLKEDFRNSFGVRYSDTQSAIREMAQRDDYDGDDNGGVFEDPVGALVRLEELDEGSPTVSVILLSAGACMMEDVVSSCDFLSWVYDRSRVVNDVPIAGRSISQVKLDKAIEVTRTQILPLFVLEHPYMQDGLSYFKDAQSKMAAARRLARYRSMFGYYSGHWFIATLRDRLVRYADGRKDRVLDRSELEKLSSTITTYVHNLDSVARVVPIPTEPRRG